jgi:DNA-binding CsgD family transcriptional regulator
MQHLRPLERCILNMTAQGVEIDEIARRVRKSPEQVEKIIAWTDIPRTRPPARRSPSPIENRVLALIGAGESHDEVGRRFGRSAAFVRQVEGLGHFRRGTELLRRRPNEGGA